MTHIPPTPSRLSSRLLRTFLPDQDRPDLEGDYLECYRELAAERGLGAANLWYWTQIALLFFNIILDSINWGVIMINNYFKITFRKLRIQRGYTLINIAGLALGIACCLLMAVNVLNELHYDDFHEHADRIFCVGQFKAFEGEVWHVNATPRLLAPALKDDLPEVEESARYHNFRQSLVKTMGRSFYQSDIRCADQAFLDIFSFPLQSGDKATALTNPHSVVLTPDMAKRYFPGEDPMGKVLNFDNEYNLTVTGVLEELPQNSMFQFQMLVPYELEESQFLKSGGTLHWRSNTPRTYIKLRNAAHAPAVLSQIKNYIREKAGTDEAPEFTITPLKNFRFSPFGGGPDRVKNLTLISTIALMILLIACINFMNLTTARSASRAREIGLRKVIGASKKALVFQFLSESMLFSMAAMLLALVLVMLLMPTYNQIFNLHLPLSILIQNYVLPVLLAIVLFTGFLGGSYPALLLSSFQPGTMVKRRRGAGRHSVILRKALVIIQFTLSLLLIIATAVIYRQIDYIKQKDMGFEKDNIVYIPLRAETQNSYDRFKTLLASKPGILHITGSREKPFEMYSNTTRFAWEGKSPEYNTAVHVTRVEYDFLETMGIELVSGRDYSPEHPSDMENSIIINERFAKDIGKIDILGSQLKVNRTRSKTIIGIVKNFNFVPVNREVPPLVMELNPYKPIMAMVRIDAENRAAALQNIRTVWRHLNPAYPFDYKFFDQDFQSIYSDETRLAGIMKSYALLGIAIAAFGILGLASFTAEQRTKEVGIRKVLGASITGVTGLLSAEFIRLNLYANLLAWPLAFYLMNRWLNDFAYRTGISVWLFIVPSAATLALTLLTVGTQTVKAALANPVQCLREE